MFKRIILLVLLVTVAMGTVFAQNQLTAAERDLVADELNNVVSQLNGLDVIISSLKSAIPVLSEIEERKGQFEDLKNLQTLFEAGKTYKNARSAGDKEAARVQLLRANLDMLNFAGKGLGTIQGMLLPLVIKAAQNCITNIRAANADSLFRAAAVETSPLFTWSDTYEKLADPPYRKYAPIGWRMLDNGNKAYDEATWKRIKIVFQALEEAQNSNNYRGSTNPVKYFIGDKGPAGGMVFMLSGNGTSGMEFSVNIPQNTWDGVLAYEQNIKNRPIGGKTDWRLPTPDELNTIYKLNKQGMFTGSFKLRNESYWAKNGNSAFAQNLEHGGTNTSPNTTEKKYSVIVRRF